MKPKESRLGTARLTGRNLAPRRDRPGRRIQRPIDFAPKAEGRLPAVRKLRQGGYFELARRLGDGRAGALHARHVAGCMGKSAPGIGRSRRDGGVGAILERQGGSDRRVALAGAHDAGGGRKILGAADDPGARKPIADGRARDGPRSTSSQAASYETIVYLIWMEAEVLGLSQILPTCSACRPGSGGTLADGFGVAHRARPSAGGTDRVADSGPW